MFWRKSGGAPGAWARSEAAKCRAAAALAKAEGDADHASTLEASAKHYDAEALSEVRADRQRRAGATLYDFSW